jgi:hypothetical protein
MILKNFLEKIMLATNVFYRSVEKLCFYMKWFVSLIYKNCLLESPINL